MAMGKKKKLAQLVEMKVLKNKKQKTAKQLINEAF